MKELSRFNLAVVKRTAQNVKGLRTKKAKLEAQLSKIAGELEVINAAIDSFEVPIVTLTGGFTSEQVLAGDMDAVPEAPVVEEAATNEAQPEDAPQPENPFFGGNTSPLPFEG